MTLPAKHWLAFLAAAALTLLTSPPSARASLRKADFPCAGCITAFPDETDAGRAPLLVVLHGDGGKASSILTVWEKAAVARGIVVFAPQCPIDDGCPKASWWQWGKDPAWFDPKIDAIDAQRPLDRQRLWIAGWSGGASYLGYRAPDLVGRFSAVSFDGGGMPPRSPQECRSQCRLESYFLIGDKNPLHGLAIDLHTWIDQCDNGSSTWDLLPGADHGGEWSALSKPAKQGTILDWFETHALTCAAVSSPPPSPIVADAASQAPSAMASPSISAPSSSAHAESAPPPPTTRCACAIPGARAEPGSIVSLAIAYLACRTARARRPIVRRTSRATSKREP